MLNFCDDINLTHGENGAKHCFCLYWCAFVAVKIKRVEQRVILIAYSVLNKNNKTEMEIHAKLLCEIYSQWKVCNSIGIRIRKVCHVNIYNLIAFSS